MRMMGIGDGFYSSERDTLNPSLRQMTVLMDLPGKRRAVSWHIDHASLDCR